MASSHMVRPVISHPCTVCGEATSNWCSRCQNMWYCSAEHLNADWRRHRTSCVPFRYSPSASPPAIVSQPPYILDGSMQQPPTPASSAQFSALFFPADEDRPRIVRVNCYPNPSSNASGSRNSSSSPPQLAYSPPMNNQYASTPRPCQWEADTKPWLACSATGSIVLTQGLNGEPLRFPIHLFYVPDSLSRGTPVNRSIFKLTNGLAQRKWSGNVIALKYSGTRRQAYSDCTTNDLPALVSYFLSFV